MTATAVRNEATAAVPVGTSQGRRQKRDNGAGSVYRAVDRKTGRHGFRGSVRWQGKRPSTTWCSSEAEAKRELRKLINRLAAGEQSSPIARETLESFLLSWLETNVKPTTKPRTYLSYKERVTVHVIPRLGHARLGDLGGQHLQQLYADLMDPADGNLSSSTVNGIHVVIHRALKQAKRWGLPRNVADDVDVPQPRRPRPKPIPVAHLRMLLERGIAGDEREAL